MRFVSLVAGFVFFSGGLGNFGVTAASASTDPRCVGGFSGASLADIDKPDARLATDLEEIPLKALVDHLVTGNIEDNIAYKHPAFIYGAYQVLLAMIDKAGSQLVSSPTSPTGTQLIFNAFSTGTPVTNGLQIIGKEREIAKIVGLWRAAARGDRSGGSMPLLVGPHGTGKTLFLDIFAALLSNLSASDPDHFMYRVVWRDLSKIPGLRPFIPVFEDAGGTHYELEGPCTQHDSPFALLPDAYQNGLTEKLGPRVVQLTGLPPNPSRVPCPHCEYYRSEVIKHYSKVEGHTLSPREIVDKLNDHVSMRRIVLGRDGSAPKIDGQPKDTDWGIVATANPLNRNTLGPQHALSIFMGKLPGAHRNIAFFDEFLRNQPDFLAAMLGWLEKRELNIGAGPTIRADAALLGSSNKANLDKYLKDPEALATIDRLGRIPFGWPTEPNEIGKTLIFMKGSDLRQQALGDESAKESLGNIGELYPRPVAGQPFQGPDGRFKLWFGDGANRVHVSPRALDYLNRVIALTRMSFDTDLALERSPSSKVAATPEFANPVVRLKVETGELRVTGPVLTELYDLKVLLEEGQFGISSRDAGRLLSDMVDEARLPENEGCITFSVVRRVLQRTLNTPSAALAPDNEARLKWLTYMDLVSKEFTVLGYQRDVVTAQASAQGNFDNIFDEFMAELNTIGLTPPDQLLDARRPRTFKFKGRDRSIDWVRHERVKGIYLAINRRPLDPGHIALLQQEFLSAGGNSTVTRNEGLLNAIKAYYQELEARVAPLRDVVKFGQTGEGTQEVRSAHGSITHSLVHKQGYCERCAQDAMDLAAQAIAPRVQVR